MENKSSLTFSFCGDYEVNALSLSKAITSLVELSTAIAEREFPDIEFRMSVKAVTPGSLRFDFVAAAVTATQTLLSSGSVEYAANLIEVVTAAFAVKKFLKGRKPCGAEESGESLTITNADGLELKLPKGAGIYFIDNRVDKSVTNIINAAKTSEGVTGITVDADEKIQIQRAEFESCSTEIEGIDAVYKEASYKKTVRKNEALFVRQADFSGELKWKFFGDQNITASILDEGFQQNVKSGQIVISSKTYIMADVEVTVALGPDGLPDDTIKPTYNILKVHSVHTVGEGQEKLNV